MVASGHTAVGVIVGVVAYQFLGQNNLAGGLVVAGIAGVLSHYLTDAIPHGHFVKLKDLKKYLGPIIIFDLLLPIILFLGGIYLRSGLGEKLLYVMFAVGGVQLPDAIDGLIFINIIKTRGAIGLENNFHQGLHWHGRGPTTLLLGWRDLWQLAAILIALYTLFKY